MAEIWFHGRLRLRDGRELKFRHSFNPGTSEEDAIKILQLHRVPGCEVLQITPGFLPTEPGWDNWPKEP